MTAMFVLGFGFKHPLTPPRECDLETFFRLYSPSARTAHQNVRTPVFQSRIEKHVSGISWNGIKHNLDDLAQRCFESEFSRRMLIAQRLQNQHREIYVQFASRFIADLFLKTFMRRETEEG